jgi:arginine-tRNA-protein transferase
LWILSSKGYNLHMVIDKFLIIYLESKMDPYTYELMMERGWRRCGTYYYKPNLVKSCCKLFTHRLQVAKFRPKKDQKKAIKKVITLAYEKI